jgi:hypothetical protein
MKNLPRWEREAVWRLCCLLVVLALTACQNPRVKVQATEEETPRMSSAVSMGDPKADAQLVSGFYGVEAGAWRWTARQFSVVLHPPPGSDQKGATLQLKLTVPPIVSERLKAISLSAMVNGGVLPAETYTRPGEYLYTRDVPPGALTAEAVRVDFQLDKAMPPSGGDLRELGVIALSVGLESK